MDGEPVSAGDMTDISRNKKILFVPFLLLNFLKIIYIINTWSIKKKQKVKIKEK